MHTQFYQYEYSLPSFVLSNARPMFQCCVYYFLDQQIQSKLDQEVNFQVQTWKIDEGHSIILIKHNFCSINT